MKSARLILILASVVVLAVACGRPEEPSRQVESPITINRSASPEADSPGGQGTEAGGLQLRFTNCPPGRELFDPPAGVDVILRVPKSSFDRDESVPLQLSVRNSSSESVDRSWRRDEQDRDFWVSSAEGTVWRWSYGDENFRGGAGTATYEPGEVRDFQVESWKSEVCLDGRKVVLPRVPGRYAARAYLVDLDSAWTSNQVEFEIR